MGLEKVSDWNLNFERFWFYATDAFLTPSVLVSCTSYINDDVQSYIEYHSIVSLFIGY